MTELTIVPDLEDYYKGNPPARLVRVEKPAVVGALDGGMASGNPSVAFIIEAPDGTTFFAETSLKLFLLAADVLKAKYGDPRVEATGPAA